MKSKIQRIKKLIEQLKATAEQKKGFRPSSDFSYRKKAYMEKELFALMNELDSKKEIKEKNENMANKIINNYNDKKFDDALALLDELEKSLPDEPDAPKPKKEQQLTDLSFVIPHLPAEIKAEIEADIFEANKCFSSESYRSVTILCGRILETALFRKYYDVTGKDLLETSPGTGLGKIIAKLKEAKVEFDPGITEQIHLINQVRVYSVHKKQKPFQPTAEQAQAMMLYTIDVLKKIF